ncbi:MAG: helix-turn-helix domain-containing protein [Peptococcaceae bacterium]|jgi:transcriptional regulator with XRE-family HTH domain|nr:helix-turn-helix domain-containing protein [Peptococcaceae bacterium]
MSHIGEKIKEARKSMGLSQREAARAISRRYGVRLNQPYLCLIEQGERTNYSAKLEHALKDFFNIDKPFFGDLGNDTDVQWLKELVSKKLQRAYINTLNAYNLLGDLMNLSKIPDPNVPGVPGATAVYENCVLKFTVPELLPRGRIYTAESRDHWMGLIIHAYSSLKMEVKMKHALCVVRTLTPQSEMWDNDNRAAVSHVINAIRHLGIVEDDTYENISLLQVGGVDNLYPRTEIYLLEKECPESLLKEAGIFPM